MNFFSFHIGDYKAHTSHLTNLEDLAYRRLLDLYYLTEKPLPEPDKCARLIGMRDNIQEVSDVLSEFFLKSDAGYINKRCDEVIAEYHVKAERARQANATRWSKSDKSLTSDALQIATKTITITNNHNQTNTQPAAEDGFAKFWSLYPKKVGKPAAMRAWKSAKLNKDDIAVLMNDVDVRCESDGWTKANGQYIPNPSTYLNQRRWEDEQAVSGSSTVSGVLPGAI